MDYKPGSVPLWGYPPSGEDHSSRRRVAATLKHSHPGTAPRSRRSFERAALDSTPIRACSGKGLPRRRSPGCHAWALTPRFHPYRANAKRSPHRPSLRSNDALRRCYFCCAFPRVTPGRCYRLPCPMEPGLSSRVRCVYAGDLPSTFGQPRDPSRSPMRFMGSDKMPRGVEFFQRSRRVCPDFERFSWGSPRLPSPHLSSKVSF